MLIPVHPFPEAFTTLSSLHSRHVLYELQEVQNSIVTLHPVNITHKYLQSSGKFINILYSNKQISLIKICK